MNFQYYKSLRAYALVCSWWRSAARPYIFRFLVLGGVSDFERLSAQLRETPAIAGWVQKVRLKGKTLPYSLYIAQPPDPEDVQEDLDTELYSFPTILGLPLSNLRVLEIVGFAQASSRLEDCKAFAQWIPKLATLTHVSRLHIIRCEMTPNSLTAIVRAFPSLKDISFVIDGYFHPNSTTLTTVYDETTAELPSLGTGDTGKGVNTEAEDTKSSSDESNPRKEAISYPIYHPPPRLRSFYVMRARAFGYGPFEFESIADWFRPECLNESLQSMGLSLSISSSFTDKTFKALGPSSKLRHLQVQYSSFEGTCSCLCPFGLHSYLCIM